MTPGAPEPGPRSGPFGPAARFEVLKLRADLLEFTRAFFRDRGLWEVETPLLSREIVVDAYLEPFVTRGDSGSECRPASPEEELYLQTSPEFAMKRLLAAGAGNIFQLTRSFRRGEIGRLHNPEFTILEWYHVGLSYREQMKFVEEFVVDFFREAARLAGTSPPGALPAASASSAREPLGRPLPQFAYDELFRSVLGTTVLDRSAQELSELARRAGIEPPPGLAADDVDGWLNLLLALAVEPALSRQRGAFVYDYPAGQAALARIRPDTPPVAERFELYLSGIEICNGYQELTDPAELRRRIAGQQALRRRDGHRPLPAESRLLAAMEAGLPECSGVALGFDRLVMTALGASALSEVLAFPFDRA